jgi:hypothetical protein
MANSGVARRCLGDVGTEGETVPGALCIPCSERDGRISAKNNSDLFAWRWGICQVLATTKAEESPVRPIPEVPSFRLFMQTVSSSFLRKRINDLLWRNCECPAM